MASALVSLDELCGRRFRYRDLVECGTTWEQHAATGNIIDNTPAERATYDALHAICEQILDPLCEHLGAPQLTYAFASAALAARIGRRIAPRLDQHASFERRSDGSPICNRGGAAVDFRIPGMPSLEVARWIAANAPFDRIYFYGDDRPLHVSHSKTPSREAYEMRATESGHLVPRRLAL